jgi:Raf kinase inhibitor-like YbhB/YbcL family protein
MATATVNGLSGGTAPRRGEWRNAQRFGLVRYVHCQIWDQAMLQQFARTLLIATLAACTPGNDSANQADGQGNVANQTLTGFKLASNDFPDGGPIPAAHTCDGADRSPQLSWDKPPPGTKSLALVVDDPDSPSGTFTHWGLYAIPPDVNGIASGQAGQFREAVNGFGESRYSGPCPPVGHGTHRYRFKLYALDVEQLAVAADAKVEQVEQEAQRHEVASAELTGTYERK